MSSPLTERLKEPADTNQTGTGMPSPKMLLVNSKLINWSSIVFAVLQSACTAVIAISGLRVAIGLSALAAAAAHYAPPSRFHPDVFVDSSQALASPLDR